MRRIINPERVYMSIKDQMKEKLQENLETIVSDEIRSILKESEDLDDDGTIKIVQNHLRHHKMSFASLKVKVLKSAAKPERLQNAEMLCNALETILPPQLDIDALTGLIGELSADGLSLKQIMESLRLTHKGCYDPTMAVRIANEQFE